MTLQATQRSDVVQASTRGAPVAPEAPLTSPAALRTAILGAFKTQGTVRAGKLIALIDPKNLVEQTVTAPPSVRKTPAGLLLEALGISRGAPGGAVSDEQILSRISKIELASVPTERAGVTTFKGFITFRAPGQRQATKQSIEFSFSKTDDGRCMLAPAFG